MGTRYRSIKMTRLCIIDLLIADVSAEYDSIGPEPIFAEVEQEDVVPKIPRMTRMTGTVRRCFGNGKKTMCSRGFIVWGGYKFNGAPCKSNTCSTPTRRRHEDVVPETTLTQNEERVVRRPRTPRFRVVRRPRTPRFGEKRWREINPQRFSLCRSRAKKCHKLTAKKTAHLKKDAHAHARAGKHAAKVAKAHFKASKHSNARAHNLVKKARAHTAKARALYRKQLWKAAKHAVKKAGAHKKVAKAHAKKARKHFHIAKKLMAYVRAKHKKCGMELVRCMK